MLFAIANAIKIKTFIELVTIKNGCPALTTQLVNIYVSKVLIEIIAIGQKRK